MVYDLGLVSSPRWLENWFLANLNQVGMFTLSLGGKQVVDTCGYYVGGIDVRRFQQVPDYVAWVGCAFWGARTNKIRRVNINLRMRSVGKGSSSTD